jgi:hypothetical protein
MGLSLWKGANDDTSAEKLAFKRILGKYGHNVLYRRYDVGNPSVFFDETTGQGKGGPSWDYYDEVIKIRHDPMSIRGAVGITIQKSKMYVEATVKPKRSDVIIELDYDLKPDQKPYEIYHMTHREAFEIDEIDVKRGISGNIIYYLCSVVPHLGDY